MALKYWFEFKDVKAIVHRVEISDATFVGSSTQVFGSCSLEYSETKDTLEPVRGSGLRIDLEANSALTFYDLYSEEERTFSVLYKRNNEILFNGWLSPEGIYESLVTDKWVISLDCTDGLGFLANLSYVEDATGLNFVGKQSLLEIVSNCLKRTKTPQNILTSVNIYYNGLSQSLNPFANVYFNANRFVKEDKGDTYMNCEEVLKSVLEPFGAVLTSYKGEWLIYKPNSLVDSSSQVFFAYNSLGVALSPASRTIDFVLDLGSQIDAYYPHHVNGNQQKTIKSSIGAYRINYKYGLIKSFFTNLFLENIAGVVDEWTIQDGTFLSFPASNKGLILESSDNLNLTDVIIYSNSFFNLKADDSITFTTIIRTIFIDGSIDSRCIFKVRLNSYFLDFNGNWTTNNEGFFVQSSVKSDITYSLNSQPLPEDGSVYIEIYRPYQIEDVNNNVLIKECNIKPYSDNLSILKGENHTFQRTLKPSSKIKDIKTVFNGDNESDAYAGAIYKADETTTTNSWTRKNQSETKPLLQIMGEERMKMYSKPLQVYKGDVYGYFNYLSLVTINGLTGKFMPTTYSYNALSNITSLELTEVLNTDILSDVLYELTFDYGNVVEPTIKG